MDAFDRFCVLFFTFEKVVTIYFNCIDSAARLFFPITPKVLCGLKHFNHPSIVICENGLYK